MISIIHPSRGRPQKARLRRDEWISKADGAIEYILSIDQNDETIDDYIRMFAKDTKIIVNRNRSLIDATNNGGKVATGDILVVVSDDYFCFPGWDTAIKEATAGRTNWVLKCYDGIQRWIVTLPILDRAYYEEQGYIYHPAYQHLFADTDMTHKADLQKRLIIRNDIVFKHLPHYIEGKRADIIAMRSNRTQQQGERTYIARIRNKFGLDINSVYDLSQEAQDHINWMKYRRLA